MSFAQQGSITVLKYGESQNKERAILSTAPLAYVDAIDVSLVLYCLQLRARTSDAFSKHFW